MHANSSFLTMTGKSCGHSCVCSIRVNLFFSLNLMEVEVYNACFGSKDSRGNQNYVNNIFASENNSSYSTRLCKQIASYFSYSLQFNYTKPCADIFSRVLWLQINELYTIKWNTSLPNKCEKLKRMKQR